jgi:hypothetical protein
MLRTLIRFLPLALVAVLLSLGARGSSAGPSLLFVNLQADTADGVCDANCSTRDAFMAANASPDLSTIMLPAGTHTLSIDGIGEDASETGDLDVTSPIKLIGTGPETSTIDGGQIDGVIFVDDDGSLEMSGVTITNGRGTDSAGGIFAVGPLVLTNVHVVGNTGYIGPGEEDGEGGIGAVGQVTIVDSMIDRNVVEGEGSVAGIWLGEDSVATITNTSISDNVAEETDSVGGASLDGDVTLNNVTIGNNTSESDESVAGLNAEGEIRLSRSRIAGNVAEADHSVGGLRSAGETTITDSVIDDNGAPSHSAGGLDQDDGTLTVVRTAITNNSIVDNGSGGASIGADAILVNVTISGNTARSIATAGITADGDVEIHFSTIANNVAAGPSATGGLSNFDELVIENSIVGGGNAPLACFQTSGSSQGNNIDEGNTCGFNQTGDQEDADADLGPLADNGGFSMTHALSGDSDAIDAADGCPQPGVDQRLIPRPQGSACDSGAFELGDIQTTARTWGDILCNENVMPDDAVALLTLASGVESAQPAGGGCPTPDDVVAVREWFISIQWGNANCDGKVDALDALYLLRYFAEIALVSPLLCPETGAAVEVG